MPHCTLFHTALVIETSRSGPQAGIRDDSSAATERADHGSSRTSNFNVITKIAISNTSERRKGPCSMAAPYSRSMVEYFGG